MRARVPRDVYIYLYFIPIDPSPKLKLVTKLHYLYIYLHYVNYSTYLWFYILKFACVIFALCFDTLCFRLPRYIYFFNMKLFKLVCSRKSIRSGMRCKCGGDIMGYPVFVQLSCGHILSSSKLLNGEIRRFRIIW